MAVPVSAAWLSSVAERFLLALLGSCLKASLAFGVVWVAAQLMRGGAARLRRLLWLGAIGSYLGILLLSLAGATLLHVPAGPEAAIPGPREAVASVLLGPLEGGGSAADPAGAAEAGASARHLTWALPLFLAWAVGLTVGLAQIAAGGIAVRRMVRRAASGPERWLPGPPRRHPGAVRRRVRVLTTPDCRVPFAAFAIRPCIVLPDSARRWPRRRLQAVLLHELRHVRRGDWLWSTAARVVCWVFWFCPLVWIAYSFLYVEQEKTCDADVVDRGVRPQDYAACLLHAARALPWKAAVTGLYFPVWRRKILEERLRAVVNPGGQTRKARYAFAVSACLVCVLVLLGSASGRQQLSAQEAYARFVGRWVNEVYPGTLDQPEVRIIRADHIGEDQICVWHTAPTGVWTIHVRKAWRDVKGNTYCKFSWRYVQGRAAGEDHRQGVGVMRVNRTGSMLQATVRCGGEHVHCPDRIDPEARQWWNRYWVYYRQ